MPGRLASALVALGAPLLFAAGAHATLPGGNGKIAFSTQYGKLMTVEPDGTGLAQVIREGEAALADVAPAWSPDGTRLATGGMRLELTWGSSASWTRTDIHVFGADGSGFTRLSTPKQNFSSKVAWSPDGTRLAYASDKLGSESIYVVNADGSDPRLVVAGEYRKAAYDPAWSPDGAWIAFAREVDDHGATDLHVVRPDGTGLRRLLERPGMETSPSWSPDGTRILFSGSDPRTGSDAVGWGYPGLSLWTVAATGGAPQRITTATHDRNPVWSPDGRLIAFDRAQAADGYSPRLWVIGADGSGGRPISDPCGACDPDWQRVEPAPAPAPPHTPSAPEPTSPQPVAREPLPPAAAEAPRITGLTLTRARFTWRGRTAAKLRVTLSRPERIAFTVKRSGRRATLRTVSLPLAAGTTHVALARVLPRKALAPGLYTATVRGPVAGNVITRTFRVVKPR